MSIRNHNLVFRPLRGGVAIFNPNAGGVGTLGVIATSDGLDRWIVSCHHVLGRPNRAPFPDGEPIYQPVNDGPASLVARTVASRAVPELDCAAARVEQGMVTSSSVLGLPPLAPPIAPVVGMRVMKSGRETGVTEGLVCSVQGDRVTIRVPDDFPAGYNLCDIGDSGAVWIDRVTGAPVVLHTAGQTSGVEQAFGVRFISVLAGLGLQVLP